MVKCPTYGENAVQWNGIKSELIFINSIAPENPEHQKSLNKTPHLVPQSEE